MGLFEKVFDLIFSKNWVSALTSFVIAFILQVVLPKSWYQFFYGTLPFENNINVVLVFCVLVILCFLLIHLVTFLRNKFKTKKESIQKQKEREAVEKERRRIEQDEYYKNIDEFKSFIDGLSDYDYSVIMYFLTNQNQKSYIQKIPPDGLSIIYNSDYFYQTHEEVPMNISNIPEGAIPVGSLTETVFKYLMKEEFYSQCKTVIKETGSLSHFDRKTIDLRQEDNYE